MKLNLLIGIIGAIVIVSGTAGIIIYKKNQSKLSQVAQPTVGQEINQTASSSAESSPDTSTIQPTNQETSSATDSSTSETSTTQTTPTITDSAVSTKTPTETPSETSSPAVTQQQDTSAVTGEYWCRSYNVDGAGGSCQLQQRLTLGSDGNYQFGSSSGTFTHSGDSITFSGDLASRGPATYTSDKEIRWEFSRDGKAYTITYYFRN